MAIPFPARKVPRKVALAELAVLEAAYPAAVTALVYRDPFELLVAVILSAQCTDARVNLTTPQLFAAYPDAAALARADLADVERIIKSCGFFRMKAKNIVNAARALVADHGGEVPREREQLEALPGVGRKTAAVVLSVAFEGPAFAVDTHVFRVAHRLGLTLGKTPRAVEDDVTKLLPPEQWRHAHHWLILHGRAICKAPVPRCSMCPVTMCPSRPLVERARLVATRPAAKPKRPAPKAAAPKATPKAAAPKAAAPKVAASKVAAPKAAAPKVAAPKAAASTTAAPKGATKAGAPNGARRKTARKKR